MKPNEQALRIEQAVRYWEDMCWLIDITGKVSRAHNLPGDWPSGRPFSEALRFRHALLRSVTTPFDQDRFIGDLNRTFGTIGMWALLPRLVFAWSKQSRRIYHLSSEIQTLLNVTSMRGLKWGDIAWPFNGFAITLSAPIADAFSGRAPDTILVSIEKNEESGRLKLEILLLPSWLSQYQGITKDERGRIDTLLKRKDWLRLSALIVKLQQRRQIDDVTGLVLNLDDPSNERIVDTVQRSTVSTIERYTEVPQERSSRDVPLLETTIRLIVGTALYVTTRPSGIAPTTEWERMPPTLRGDPSVVTHHAETCVVQSAYRLDPLDVKTFEEVGTAPHAAIELSPHFRSGFWRRHAGEGRNLNAPKTIWVKPTIVRADRLPPGTLPRGSQAKVV